MPTKSIATQIVEFVTRYKDKVNKEPFTTIEFIIKKGKLDGMRIKDFIKNREENKK